MLTQLDLGLNEIGDDEAKVLAQCLQTSMTLTLLDLRCNQIQMQPNWCWPGSINTNFIVTENEL